jgi:hypothetical protein
MPKNKKSIERKERRLRRKNEKRAKEKEKNARLSQSVVLPNRGIRSLEIPPIVKSPRSIDSRDYLKYFFKWDISEADLLGEWSWGEPRKWNDTEYSRVIESHFSSQTGNIWEEIETQTYDGAGRSRRLKNKEQPLDSLIIEAQERWRDFEKLSEFENLFRFRLGTDRRVWGVRIQHCFFIVWYERHHCICPVNGKDCKKGSF